MGKKKIVSTFEKVMTYPKRKESFNRKYSRFLATEVRKENENPQLNRQNFDTTKKGNYES